MDETVETALRELAREQPDAEAVARQAWDDLTAGSGEARDVSQWWLQLFCWDQLARADLGGPAERWRTARALGDLLERIGLHRYAAIARSDTTRDVLLASDDPERYSRTYAGALRVSGIQPPDTDLLTWGPVMGPAEADSYERAANALELSLVSGAFAPGARGSRRARRAMTDAVLTNPHRDLDGLRPLYGIATERLHGWTASSPTLAELVAPLTADLTSGVPVPLTGVPEAFGPLEWLLHRLAEPAPLSAAGYLRRDVVDAFVREVEIWPAFRQRTSRRELDIPQLRMLREAAHRLGLVRVHRRALVLTPRGRAAAAGGGRLAEAVAAGWFPARRDAATVAREVVTALLTGGRRMTGDEVADVVRQVLTEDGWTVDGGPVPQPAAGHLAVPVWRDVLYLGMVQRAGGDYTWQTSRVARPVLVAALRHHLLHHGLHRTLYRGPVG